MREIPLANGRGVALVDDEDYVWLSEYQWHVRGRGAGCKNGRRNEYMHRMIMSPAPGLAVVHIDFNRLNNQKVNLREATRSQQSWSRMASPNWADKHSRFRGVSWRKRVGIWRVQTGSRNGRVSLGHFQSEEDAARAYDHYVRETQGEFARLNFPREGERSALREIDGN